MILLDNPPLVPREVEEEGLRNGDAFQAALGDVPWHRIIFNPPPGTVTGTYYDAIDGRVGERLVELVDGTLVEKPVGMDESRIAGNLLTEMNIFVRHNKLGFVAGEAGTVKMNGGNRRMPDVAVYLKTHYPDGRRPTQKVPEIPPRLAVEVLSDDNTEAEMAKKLREFFTSGCRLSYLIDPKARTARRFSSPAEFTDVAADDVLDGGDVLPGFEVRLTDLFEDE
jgi:Uma2 family endonuclease